MKRIGLLFPLLFVYARAAEVGSLQAILASEGFGNAKLERRLGNHLAVPVTINGHHAGLMIDTGAPSTLIDTNSVNTFGLTAKKTDASVGGVWGWSAERYGVSKLNAIAMGNLTLTNVPVALSNHSDMNYYGGLRHLDGLFGAHEMYKFGVVIDCARQMIYINPNGASGPLSQKLAAFFAGRGFTRIPMRVDNGGHFQVDCAINGQATTLIVDTGSGTTLLTKDRAVKCGIMPAPLMATEKQDGQVERMNSGTIKTLSIGGFEIENAEVVLGNISRKIFSSGPMGLLGEEHLTYNFAVIDVGGLSLYLRHPDKR